MGKCTTKISYIPANSKSKVNTSLHRSSKVKLMREKEQVIKESKRSKKKAIEVVECPNFDFVPSSNKNNGKKRSVSSASVTDTSNVMNTKDEKKNEKDNDVDVTKEFRSIYREVVDYGAANFDGRKKKDYEAKRITQLGGKGIERTKIPYNILMGIKKKEKIRQNAREEYLLASELITGEKKFSATYAGGSVNISGRGEGKQNRKKDISRYDDIGKSVQESKVGKYRDGMLYINQSFLKQGKDGGNRKGGNGGGKGKGKRR